MLFGRRDRSGANETQTNNGEDSLQKKVPESQKAQSKRIAETGELSSALVETRNKIFDELVKQMDLRKVIQASPETLVTEIEQFISRYTEERQIAVSYTDQRKIANEIVNDMIGLGPLEQLMSDTTISDIMINGPNSV
ncbi:MAG: hypothetical protein K2X53_06330, partial [Alphaproteobacteria bacterium]|nr:hypothetical protein [Alphaproteobacteria bacterium]